jgi:hypothetical protein
LIERQGKLVFLSESFDLSLARKLQILLTNAQNTGEQESVRMTRPNGVDLRPELTAVFSRYFAGFGMMRTALRP